MLYEVLIKLGLDLCTHADLREIAGKSVHSIGGGTLMACLDEHISVTDAEPLALGIAAWRGVQATAGLPPPYSATVRLRMTWPRAIWLPSSNSMVSKQVQVCDASVHRSPGSYFQNGNGSTRVRPADYAHSLTLPSARET